MPITWSTPPRKAPPVTAAIRRARARGPAALAEIATLSLWLHYLNTRGAADDAYPGIFLAHVHSLLRNLAATDSGPLPTPFLPLWLDSPQPQVQLETVSDLPDEDEALAAFRETTAERTPAESRARAQQEPLDAFLASGSSTLVRGALETIKETYLSHDWKRYFEYGLSLDTLCAQLQPYATVYEPVLFDFFADLLAENAIHGHYDPLLLTSCLNWFLVTWSGPDALIALADRVAGWQTGWPVVVVCVHNRFGRTIRNVQFGPPDAFDKTNRLLDWSGGRSIGSMLAQKDRIRPNDEAYFVFPLPEGGGTYRLRVEAGGMLRVFVKATTETEATLTANDAYVWTVSAQGVDQVQPLELLEP